MPKQSVHCVCADGIRQCYGKLGQQAAADLLAEVWVDRVVEEVAGYRDDVHALTLNLRETSDHYCKNLFCCSQNVGESQ